MRMVNRLFSPLRLRISRAQDRRMLRLRVSRNHANLIPVPWAHRPRASTLVIVSACNVYCDLNFLLTHILSPLQLRQFLPVCIFTSCFHSHSVEIANSIESMQYVLVYKTSPHNSSMVHLSLSSADLMLEVRTRLALLSPSC